MSYWNETINDLAKILTKYERMPEKKTASSIYDSTHAWRDNVF
jgi:hypothetical protein